MGAVSDAGIVPGVTVFGPAPGAQSDVSALMAAAARSMVATATDAPGAVQHLRTASLRVAAPVSVHMTMPSQHAAAALREAQAHHLRTLSGGIGGGPAQPMQVNATGVYAASRGGVGPADFTSPHAGGVVMAGGAPAHPSHQQRASTEGQPVQRANTTASLDTTATSPQGGDSVWVVHGSPAASPLTASMAGATSSRHGQHQQQAPQGQTPGGAFAGQ
jgi:hypothetical protein